MTLLEFIDADGVLVFTVMATGWTWEKSYGRLYVVLLRYLVIASLAQLLVVHLESGRQCGATAVKVHF